MPDTETGSVRRWQALDVIKTLAVLEALTFHVLIWWFGGNSDKNSAAFYAFDIGLLPSLSYFILVHFVLVAAGTAFYFYLGKYKPSFGKVFSRALLLALFGILFGLNLNPPAIFWNIFLFYALSILVIFSLNRGAGKNQIIFLTLAALFLTPFLRPLFNALMPGNYLSAVLVGDIKGDISFYPFFPWFFLVGAGFLTGYFYSKYGWKKFANYGLPGGIIAALVSIPFFKPLNLSDVFGNTAHMPISYLIFIFGSFIFLISLLELALKNVTLSKYNPAVAIGRHILPVYVITVFATLALTDFVKRHTSYGNSVHVFLLLELSVLLTAYLIGIVFTRRAERKAGHYHGF